MNVLQTMFHYNWQVREDWYRWCEDISPEDLIRDRIGGAGGILFTLFHIIDVEWSWIRSLQGKQNFQENFEVYNRLRKLDAEFQEEVRPFVLNWEEKLEKKIFTDIRPDGSSASYAWGEVMRHVIAHEIHHIGQLSVWAREIGKKPVSANLIGRGLSIS